jgi:hypothetical protein
VAKHQVDVTYHEACFDDPERIGADRACGAGDHGRQDVEGPRMLAHNRLIALGGRRGIEAFRLDCRCIDTKRQFAETSLDPIVHGEVDGPRRKITEYGRPETAVQTSKPIVSDDVAKRRCFNVRPRKKSDLFDFFFGFGMVFSEGTGRRRVEVRQNWD